MYIACGISGQIQHLAGMQDSGIIISVNSDPDAPINAIADYVVGGTVEEVVPKMIKYYEANNKQALWRIFTQTIQRLSSTLKALL